MKLLHRRREEEPLATFGQFEYLDRLIRDIRHPGVRETFHSYAMFRTSAAPPADLTRGEMSDLIVQFGVLIDRYRSTGVVPNMVVDW